ncbi:hypothetical protein CISG_06027 [Coccidioides immitis RMSCC 3703]|nr:hypothetical protein CIRG_02487 [Coccidioides immitis RMSCC 2394]KMU77183.1 hypothetical protein CISG_06027 [Coccidioides immitis RMSCC 3703]
MLYQGDDTLMKVDRDFQSNDLRRDARLRHSPPAIGRFEATPNAREAKTGAKQTNRLGTSGPAPHACCGGEGMTFYRAGEDGALGAGFERMTHHQRTRMATLTGQRRHRRNFRLHVQGSTEAL